MFLFGIFVFSAQSYRPLLYSFAVEPKSAQTYSINKKLNHFERASKKILKKVCHEIKSLYLCNPFVKNGSTLTRLEDKYKYNEVPRTKIETRASILFFREGIVKLPGTAKR